jgi:predicted metalloenzyme YecM
MGISIPDETMVAVKLSGWAAKADKPVNKTLAVKKNDTRYRIHIFDMTSSLFFL